jgi:alginate O-acetyltransferase complex protein AlgI
LKVEEPHPNPSPKERALTYHGDFKCEFFIFHFSFFIPLLLFNSLNFALFLPVVFLLYWFVTQRNLGIQNILLLAASYFFYACWDYRFVFLLAFSTLLDYFTGLKMYDAKNKPRKRFWFWLSVIVNLGFLGFFKYYNFFAANFEELLAHVGIKADFVVLKVILPLGISFYTFHGLSYVMDIYNERIKPERNFIDYAVFVSFFPLLVAGPIERATHLLPQIKKARKFDYAKAVDGLRQILWGLLKKIVIADNCAIIANNIFGNFRAYNGSTLVLGAVFFAIQIYCDFSGYSDIALGAARLLGIDLLRNFAFPYFSRNIAEFWRRWHISLSSWFKDYLYIPLGGSKGDGWQKIRNVLVIFLVSGFWHGANWTFIVWGLLNALYILPSIVFKTHRNNLDIVASGRYFPTLREFTSMAITFALTTFAWIFFRAENVSHALAYVSRIFTASLFTLPQGSAFLNDNITIFVLFLVVSIFFCLEWLGREHKYAIEKIVTVFPRPVRWLFYYSLIWVMFTFQGKTQQFIYFQF